MGEGGFLQKAPLPPNPHPRKNFYYGPWLMLRPVFFVSPFGHGVLCLTGIWDACAACDFAYAARGKVGPVMGLRPLRGPPCIPPGAPRWEKSSISVGWRGHASCAAGASFPRGARSGDLPPRRVNARVRLRFDQNPLQPHMACYSDVSVCPLYLRVLRFSHPR